ncbi:transposase [Micromonospora sp. NPDC050276]|uniref:transposase n=1 Tax=Micromonospora sp. NPDC050276 TaxID=3364278 RepID=UPI00378DE121
MRCTTDTASTSAWTSARVVITRSSTDQPAQLPTSCTDDRDRCRAAGIPDEVQFATKVQMARDMLAWALDAGAPVGWVTMDRCLNRAAAVHPLMCFTAFVILCEVWSIFSVLRRQPSRRECNRLSADGGGHDGRGASSGRARGTDVAAARRW